MESSGIDTNYSRAPLDSASDQTPNALKNETSRTSLAEHMPVDVNVDQLLVNSDNIHSNCLSNDIFLLKEECC